MIAMIFSLAVSSHRLIFLSCHRTKMVTPHIELVGGRTACMVNIQMVVAFLLSLRVTERKLVLIEPVLLLGR